MGDRKLHVVQGDAVEPALRVTVADARAPAPGDNVAEENVPDDARRPVVFLLPVLMDFAPLPDIEMEATSVSIK